MEVIKCTLADLEQLAQWSMEAQIDGREGDYWGSIEETPELLAEERRTMETYLNRPDYDVYRFVVDGETVGQVTVRAGDMAPYLESFSIRREYRRRHYGTQALRALMAQLGTKGLELEVFWWNQRARSFYESFGFKPVSVMMYYDS